MNSFLLGIDAELLSDVSSLSLAEWVTGLGCLASNDRCTNCAGNGFAFFLPRFSYSHWTLGQNCSKLRYVEYHVNLWTTSKACNSCGKNISHNFFDTFWSSVCFVSCVSCASDFWLDTIFYACWQSKHLSMSFSGLKAFRLNLVRI